MEIVKVTPVVAIVAPAEIVNELAPTETTVAPEGIPVPATIIPGRTPVWSSVVGSKVTVALEPPVVVVARMVN